MKRSGFTMIELVFVIVILGILASVAIPKLAATRDDAQIAKASTELASLVSDMGSYYTAKGSFDDNVSQMTNVQVYADGAGSAAATTFKQDATAVFYIDKTRAKECITITSIDTNGTVTLAAHASAADSVFCIGLNKSVKSLLTTHTFGGSSIY